MAVVKGHSTFDPSGVLTIPDILFTQQAYDNLVLRDLDSLNAVPMLAQSWPPEASSWAW